MDQSHQDLVRHLALRAKQRQGRALVVGGCVRDEMLGLKPKDVDIELAGIPEDEVDSFLSASVKHVERVGRSFPVWKVWPEGGSHEDAIDVALPRREIKTGPKHTDFTVVLDPTMTFEEAAYRRDFTINTMGMDPLTGEVLDPFGGEKDLRAGVLRHTSPHFGEDPLRVLRGMQFCGRFDMVAAPETIEACRALDMSGLSKDRFFTEFEKFILKSKKPSRGLEFLEQTGWLQHFPELVAIKGIPQDPEWHPEGDVWAHTKHCLDAYASTVPKTGKEEDDLAIGLAVLCHDLGKPTHTIRSSAGRWTSPGHEGAGEGPTRSLLGRITDQSQLIDDVVSLVKSHMIPRDLWSYTQSKGDDSASDRALRRLSQRVRLDRLAQVCRCDKAGRPPLAIEDPASDWLSKQAQCLSISTEPPKPLLQGRDLMGMGMTPGPSFKPILKGIYERQIDGEITTREEALAMAQSIMAGDITPAILNGKSRLKAPSAETPAPFPPSTETDVQLD